MAKKLSNQPDIFPGKIISIFSREKVLQLANSWLSIFSQDSNTADTKRFMWHVFSGNTYQSLSKQEAIDAYLQQQASRYVVLSNDRDWAALTDIRPEKCSCTDYYVFPENFAWTMAFTHEEGWLGPFFARHPNYEILNHANAIAANKVKQTEQAKLNGWV